MPGLVEQAQQILLRFLGGSVTRTSGDGGLSTGLPRRERVELVVLVVGVGVATGSCPIQAIRLC